MRLLKRIINIIFTILMVLIVVLLINGIVNKGIYISYIDTKHNNIPESLIGYKILQITDVHSIRSTEQLEKYVKKIEKENPNVIFITGDLIDAEYYVSENDRYNNKEVGLPDIFTIDFCKELTEIAKVYYVYGNHEMMLLDDPENNVFKTKLESLGVTILNNKEEIITLGKESYRLIGLQDPATLYKDKKYAFIGESNKERMDSILHDLFLDKDETLFTICLSHRPEYFDLYQKYPIDVVFTGHAHGGIARLPFIGGVYAHAQGWFPKYSEGLHIDNDRLNMICGRGIGNSTINFRFMNPPEIVVTTLLKK